MRTLIMCLFGMTIAFSCKDDELTEKVVLDRITYGDHNQKTNRFLYDDAARLVRQEYIVDNKLVDYSEYTYNVNDQLATRSYFVADFNGNFGLYYSDIFSYDSDNKLAEVVVTGARDVLFKLTWKDGSIVKVERHEDNLMTYEEYQYSIEGNIATIVNRFSDGSVHYVLNCLYDNRHNPFYDFKNPLEIASGNVTKISPNNLTSMTQRNKVDGEVYATTEITYTYTEDGLPKERIYKITSLGHTSESLTKYFYKRI